MFNEEVVTNEEEVVELNEEVVVEDSIESRLKNFEFPKSEPTKKDKCLELWRVAEEKGIKLQRKEWIIILMKEVGLTLAGSKTYYQHMKSGRWS